MAKKQVIIDTDCGIDDAQAIMMALAAPNIQIVGVTCVFGNAAVENVCQNVLRVLSICEREGIPVFQGAGGPLVGASNPLSDHFGSDGLGDVIENKDPQWEEKIQSEHAVNAMIRLVTENQKQVSLVALGPLTNLALAVRLDPCFPQKLKDLYIMGGNMEGIGNVTLCAEFNFAKDPESAYIVLEEFLCPTYLASWEYSCRNALTWKEHHVLRTVCIVMTTKGKVAVVGNEAETLATTLQIEEVWDSSPRALSPHEGWNRVPRGWDQPVHNEGRAKSKPQLLPTSIETYQIVAHSHLKLCVMLRRALFPRMLTTD
ncbi:probable uridine nucleosidase 1 isoform X2 [Siniperca chuatsi]|uniref:probable uridine nucleosidase 1 isoform X2 n=1 Tax=Siniperca chuatsi TaxID=119488 RepID=UPI001CE0A2AF|nr:probable uridine nucleosidase 1 isoform X2 [Siniperca chuatsi]